MKFLDKLGLLIFGIITIIVAMTICAAIFGMVDMQNIAEGIKDILESDTRANIILGIQIALMLFAIKCIFFNSYSREQQKNKEGIILENENGKLMVSRDTIENLTNLVAKNFENAQNVSSKVFVDKDTNIRIILTMQVLQDAVIKDLSSKLQEDVKEAVKKSLSLDVKEVTVKVKSVAPRKEPTIKE